MCLSNFHNHFGNMQVFLSFGVYYDGSQDSAQLKEEEQKKKEEVSRELNSTLSIIEVSAGPAGGQAAGGVMKSFLSCRAAPTAWRFTSSTCSATTASAA